VSQDRRLGDKRPSQTVARLGADASLPSAPNSTGEIPARTTKSGHHLSAYKRTHYGGQYPEGGGRGPGGPRYGDDAASVASSKSAARSAGGPRDPKTQSSPKHGFSRTHDGGYWGKSRARSVMSARSDVSGASDRSSSTTRFPRNKTELNVREDELDRITGFSRKPNGGYWKDRTHTDPNMKTRPASARSHRWEPPGEKLWTPRAAYVRKRLGEFYRPSPQEEGARNGVAVASGADLDPQIFDTKAADPTKPKPGYTRTYWGSYYRDPDRGIEMSPGRTAQSSVPPRSGFTRTPLGGFFRGKTFEENPDLGAIEPQRHFDAMQVSPTREADPAAPGPGYTRTNYGGFYIREKQYAE
jgi:hypothetical protein